VEGKEQGTYLFKTESRSCNSGRSGRVAPLSCADVVLGAPLERFASMSVRLRFAGDGDEDAAGSIGGVRVPLAVAMVMAGAGRDAGAMPSRRATRSGRGRRICWDDGQGLQAAQEELGAAESSRELYPA
jgi:hypothetical protein